LAVCRELLSPSAAFEPTPFPEAVLIVLFKPLLELALEVLMGFELLALTAESGFAVVIGLVAVLVAAEATVEVVVVALLTVVSTEVTVALFAVEAALLAAVVF
jgi:hypothetical protein